MSVISDNVIPGDYGKIFSTNAEELKDLEKIKTELMKIKSVRDVQLNADVFPLEFTIHTKDIMKVREVEDAAIAVGFHAIPKGLFEL